VPRFSARKWILALSFVVLGTTGFASPPELVFIVNAQNPITSLSAQDIKDFYFKNKDRWPDGTPVRFIDRTPDNPLRKVFLRKFLRKTAKEVELYWVGQKLYSGNSAPLQESTDTMTIQFVSAFRGSVGYVSSGAELDSPTVKVIQIEK
jgi:hypothetical protein